MSTSDPVAIFTLFLHPRFAIFARLMEGRWENSRQTEKIDTSKFYIENALNLCKIDLKELCVG